jgi:hypothetical protein
MRSIIFSKEIMKIIKPITIPKTGGFSRASTAYYTNAANLLVSAAVDEPRFNYNSANMKAGPVVLLEAAGTNICQYSNTFSNTEWIKLAATITQGFLAPDASTNAWRLKANAGVGNAKGVVQIGSTTPPDGSLTTYTSSVYVKAGTANWVEVIVHGAEDGAYFDVFNGVVGKVFPGVTATIQAAPNGYYRCSITTTLLAPDLYFWPGIMVHTADNQGIWTSVGTEYVDIWGFQLEISPKVTSYIPTVSTTPVTRAADVRTSSLLSSVPENDFPLYNAATTYAVGAKVLDLATHKIYSSVVASNVGKPLTDTAYWLDNGYDNRWRMFDSSISSQTTGTSPITIGVVPASRFDSIVGLNVSASSITLNVVDPTAGLVYSKVIQMVNYVGINNWYDYFYKPMLRMTDFVIEDIPPVFSNSTISMSFYSTSTPAIGTLIIGLSKTLGVSEWGAKLGIVDYSVKTVDTFGGYTIVPRNFSKRADFSIQVPTDQVDDVFTTLAAYRSTPIIYMGSNTGAKQQFNSAILYGYYKDFSISIAYSGYSVCTMQIEGLT